MHTNQSSLNTMSFSICWLKHLRQITFFSDDPHIGHMQATPVIWTYGHNSTGNDGSYMEIAVCNISYVHVEIVIGSNTVL